jgi:hypothetical protein
MLCPVEEKIFVQKSIFLPPIFSIANCKRVERHKHHHMLASVKSSYKFSGT